MKTFETEKGNIPEGATHYSNETRDMYFAWRNAKGESQVPSVDLEWVIFSPVREWKPIPQANIETPEEKEVEWVNGDIATYEGKQALVIAYHPHHPSVVIELPDNEYLNVLDSELSKPETEAERVERERLESAYDLYEEAQHAIGCIGYDDFDFFKKSDIQVKFWLAIVDKTNYRKESE